MTDNREDRDDILVARAANAVARLASTEKGKDMSEWEDESGSRELPKEIQTDIPVMTFDGSKLSLVPTCFTLRGGEDWAVKIRWEPRPTVEVNTGIDWDAAAKLFWNAVARQAGQTPPFGW